MHQFDFIRSFLQAKVKNMVFVKLDSRCLDYFPSYSGCFGRALRLLKYMYGMTNYRKLSADELTDFFINKSGFKKSHFQMPIYYNHAPDGTKRVVFILC